MTFSNSVIDMDTLVMVKADEGEDPARLLDALMGIPGVDGALELSGASDMLLRIRSDSLSESRAAIEAVKSAKGVKSAGSFLVIGERQWQR